LEQKEGPRVALSLHAAFEQASDAMFLCDRDSIILDVNPAFTKIYGYTRQETIGQKPRMLRSRHSTNDLYERMWGSLMDPGKGHWRGRLVNRAKDGREIPVILTITAVREPGGGLLGYVANAVDITDQLALLERVAQSEALAGLGEMAAVVAHEIRNPLGSIVMAAKQLAADSHLGSEDRETVLRVLRDESRRLNETLTSFLAYARPRELHLAPGDLNALVEETCRMVQSNRDLLRGNEVRTRLDRNLPAFPMDVDQVRQVVWNILLNAVQAIGDRGAVTVETEHRPGEAVIRVLDTGPGIAPDARAAIFKPFFTTKRQGTGLGLAIAERVVKAHGGRIEVDSAPGRGAEFLVHLPLVEA